MSFLDVPVEGKILVSPEQETSPLRQLRKILPPVSAFLLSRLLVAAVLYVGPVIDPAFRRSSFFLSWDGSAYFYIAAHGYPPLYPPGGGYLAQSAFFPLLPWLTRWVSYITRLPLKVSAFGIVFVSGLTACLAVWWLALDTLRDRESATRAIMLTALWPASFILSMNYSEGLFITFAALSLLALRKQRWAWAGAAAVLAGLARPDGVVLAFSAAWCAFIAIRTRRVFRSIIPVLMAPLGMLSYFSFLAVRRHDFFLWFKAEHRGWHAGFDFGRQSANYFIQAIEHPTTRIDLVASSAAGIAGIVLVLWAIRDHLPMEQILFAAGVLLLALGSGFGGSIPRFVLDAFPLFTVPGKRLGRSLGQAYVWVIAFFVTGFVTLMLIVTLTQTTVP